MTKPTESQFQQMGYDKKLNESRKIHGVIDNAEQFAEIISMITKNL